MFFNNKSLTINVRISLYCMRILFLPSKDNKNNEDRPLLTTQYKWKRLLRKFRLTICRRENLIQVLHIKRARNTKRKRSRREAKSIKKRRSRRRNAKESKVEALHLHDHQAVQVQAVPKEKEADQRRAVVENLTVMAIQAIENHTNNQNFTKSTWNNVTEEC